MLSDELAKLGYRGIAVGLDLAEKERMLEARWESRETSSGS
jgi:hypothetical protein